LVAVLKDLLEVVGWGGRRGLGMVNEV